ncbi:MAG TPA: c-type cytochrome [Allosphingosinicella sp.]|jgi:mono/diheme cytochrome c family protein
MNISPAARRGALRLLPLLLAACGSPAPEPDEAPAAQAAPEVAFARLSADPVAHGERLATVLGCNGCHGKDLTGEDWSDPEWGRLWTANLTRAVPRYTDDSALERAIRGGIGHGGRELWEMPSHLFTHLSDSEMKALIAWLRTHRPAGEDHPPPTFGPRGKREIAAGTWRSSAADIQKEGNRWPPDAGSAHALGRYIVRATCSECHGLGLEGDKDQEQDRPAPPLAVAAAYDREQFRTLLRTGKPIGGRELRLMSGAARWRYSRLTEAELDAVYEYLKAVSDGAARKQASPSG